ncbi:hypothetical protein DIPPA_02099 [Diplonema papillatum]|nr:hypothetical protein DIPPA_02099 [Diplonema papillatum]
MTATWGIEDEAKRNAKRTELMVKGGPVEKWAALIDGVLAKSKSGFALFDRLTMADIHIFVYFGFFRSGGTPGIPKDSLDHLVHICKHKDKIANVPQVKDYYKGNENPAYAFLKA